MPDVKRRSVAMFQTLFGVNMSIFIPVPAMSIAVPMDALRAASKTVRSGPRQKSEKTGGL